MSFTRNTRIQTMDNCHTCAGKGTIEQEGRSMQCSKCAGLGKEFITVGDIFKFVENEIAKERRR